MVALPHAAPLASCHLLVAPRRHVAAFYDLDAAEQHQIWNVVDELRHRITASLRVERFHVGFADGDPGDPTAHTHVHLIPRIVGDPLELPEGIQWVELDS